jgi:hypothetical protein
MEKACLMFAMPLRNASQEGKLQDKGNVREELQYATE